MTGSNYLLEAGGHKILVDCGLAQGGHYIEHQNFEPFPYDPAEIEAVFITHAHIDHTGRLPKLLKDGFKGTIYSTPPTKDFVEALLLDSEQLLKREAEREGHPPLYNVGDVEHVMQVWRVAEYHKEIDLGDVRVTFLNAGHILGSAIIKITEAAAPAHEGEPRPSDGREGKTIVFSGDLGNYPSPLIPNTEFVDSADYCVMESTYGNRVHEGEATKEEQLRKVIVETMHRGGVLMIPAFALERTQDILFFIHDLMEKKQIPKVPVFLDSPLAIRLTTVYKKYEHNFAESGRVKHADEIFNFPSLRPVLTKEQSKAINEVPSPKIIIAGSGMSNGGRILHHEMRYLPDPKSTILFVGYQAQNTLGRRIEEGATQVRIKGQEIAVRCENKTLTGYSAHADQPRLLEWVGKMRATVKRVFLVHGEPDASAALAQKIRENFHLNVEAAKEGETVVL